MKAMKRVLSLVLALTLCIGMLPFASISASAATSSTVATKVSSNLPIVTYAIPLSGTSRVYSYSDATLPAKATGYYIDTFKDQIVITKIRTDGKAVYVTYPSSSASSGYRSRWFATDDILGIACVNVQSYTASAKSTSYRMSSISGVASYGSIAKNDGCVSLGSHTVGSKTYYPTIYPISSGTYNGISGVKHKLALATSAPTATTGNVGNAVHISTSGTTSNPVSGSFVRIRYSVNNRYLDVPAEGISDNGNQLQIWDYAPGNQNQIFQLTDTGKGWRITSLQSGKVIEVRNSSHNDCAQVAQWDKHSLACARWDIVKNSDGTVSFRNRESGKYLNVYGGGNAGNGTKMIQYHDDNTSAMRFLIEPVTISGNTTTTGTISSSKIKQEKDLSIRSWHPLNGLTRTMLEQDEILESNIKLPSGVEAFNTSVDAIGFVLSWVCNSSEVTRIHVTEGTNGLVSIRYGTSIEQNRSGKKMSLAQMLTEAHRGEAAYVLWAASDADKCIRNWFGLSGNGKYSMELSFGKVKYGDYGYALIIENGAIRQIPLIHSDSSYDIYYKENQQTHYVMDAADVLRNTKLPLADDEARTVMIQLVKNGYIK